MFARFSRYVPSAIMIAVLLAGCDQKAFLQKLVPKDDDAFARRFLDAVRTGDYAAADQMLVASLRSAKSESGLREIITCSPMASPCYRNHRMQPVHQRVQPRHDSNTNLSYQIHFPDAWAAGNIAVGHRGMRRLL